MRVENNDGVSIPEDVHFGDTDQSNLHARRHHVHLPKLEEAGFIRWERSDHHVFRGPAFDRFEPLLELLSDTPRNCHTERSRDRLGLDVLTLRSGDSLLCRLGVRGRILPCRLLLQRIALLVLVLKVGEGAFVVVLFGACLLAREFVENRFLCLGW